MKSQKPGSEIAKIPASINFLELYLDFQKKKCYVLHENHNFRILPFPAQED